MALGHADCAQPTPVPHAHRRAAQRVQAAEAPATGHACGSARGGRLLRLLDRDSQKARRQLARAIAFESFLNNGLGSFAESNERAHITRGIEVVEHIEQNITFDHYPGLHWQLACLFARGRRYERALDEVERAVAAGESAQGMAADSDLASIVTHERFRALLD